MGESVADCRAALRISSRGALGLEPGAPDATPRTSSFLMDQKSFLGALFDVSFSSFITTRIIKVLFLLQTAVAGIASLMIAGAGFAQGGFFMGLLSLVIVAPLVFLLWVLMIRVQLELVMVIFRIAENTAITARASGQAVTNQA
jgi:hypothetical protein